MKYADRIKAVLTPTEKKLFTRLSSPARIQDYLETLPNNFNLRGDTYMSPRRTIALKRAHCAEGALLAAAALAYHGRKPLLMDLRCVSADVDVDHVVALFREGTHWGAISKTNYPVLRYRDPIYPDIRSLALSYFHEYFLEDGQKTLREYSAPFDLSRYAPEKWVTAPEELDDIIDALDESRHFKLIPKGQEKKIRRASRIERKINLEREWKRDGTRGY